MNSVNIVVCLIYLLIVPLIIYFFKASAKNTTIHLTQSQIITSKQSITFTVSRFLLHRYTGLSIKHSDKKYILSQFLTLGLVAVSLLRLNRIMFYQIGLLPLAFLITLIINDIWLFKVQNKNKSLEETDGEVVVQPRWNPLSIEQVLRCALTMVTITLLAISAYKIDGSISNLGELNIFSTIIGLAIDQLAFRPLAIGIIIGGFKIAQLIKGTQQLMSMNYMKQITYQEYLRDSTNENITIQIVLQSQQKSCSDEKTSSPLRLPKVVEKQQQSHEGTLAELLKLHSSIYKSEKGEEEIKVEDISIIDRIQEPDDIPHLQEITSKGTDDNKQNEDNEQMEMDMVELDILKQKNQDLYLANIWPSKQLDLPQSFHNSPKYKKHKINKKRRVLVLSGNSPYLEYLPNMLKKQQSENKLKNQSKNLVQGKSAFIQTRK